MKLVQNAYYHNLTKHRWSLIWVVSLLQYHLCLMDTILHLLIAASDAQEKSYICTEWVIVITHFVYFQIESQRSTYKDHRKTWKNCWCSQEEVKLLIKAVKGLTCCNIFYPCACGLSKICFTFICLNTLFTFTGLQDAKARFKTDTSKKKKISAFLLLFYLAYIFLW